MKSIVITVHGTNDGAPADAGAQWWQTGSGFHERLRASTEARNVALDMSPFHWDGANSDVSRRAAGAALAKRLCGLLRAGETVSVVGHSHGGNVIAYALEDPELASAHKCGALRVVTVGTPFLIGRRRVVSIVNDVVRRTIMSAVILFVALIGLVMAGALDGLKGEQYPAMYVLENARSVTLELPHVIDSVIDIVRDINKADGPPVVDPHRLQGPMTIMSQARWVLNALAKHPWTLVAIMAAALALTLSRPVAILWRHLVARVMILRARRVVRDGPHWTVIAHPADEAIGLLKATPTTKLDPMTAAGAARSVRRLTPLIALATAIAAIAFIWTSAARPIVDFPERFIRDNTDIVAQAIWARTMQEHDVQLAYTEWTPEGYRVGSEEIARAAGDSGEQREKVTGAVHEADAIAGQLDRIVRDFVYRSHAILEQLMPLILVVLSIGALLAAWFVQLAVVVISPLLGRGLSYFANRSVTGSMVGAALGEDGENVIGAVSVTPPKRFAVRAVNLSEAATEQMYAEADRNAGESLRRMRRSLGTMRAQSTGDAFSDMMQYISWRELIHTSYFENEEVGQLIVGAVTPREAVQETAPAGSVFRAVFQT